MPARPDPSPVSRRRLLLGGLGAAAALPAVQFLFAVPAHARPMAEPIATTGAPARPMELLQPPSRFFATVDIPYSTSLNTASDGDLWPACWADDDNLYTSNGDGRGFSDEPFSDIVMNKVTGTPETGLAGERLSFGDAIAPVWTDPAQYNRKPTGIVAVDGNGDGRDELYLAVQDLRYSPAEQAFNDAPAAGIVVSEDYGVTWRKPDSPMFTDYVFTTIMFLDFGKSNANAAVLGAENAGYVYAYGLDHNWRDSRTDIVPDPVDLYLARVPAGSIMDRAAWEFFSGQDSTGAPTWNADITARVAVLHDDRKVFQNLRVEGSGDMCVISQSSVVYNPGLNRYLYTSWTDVTFEFYEAPQPWGPWKLFSQKVFGPMPWWNPSQDPAVPGPKNGGYGTVVPSKYISADGRRMWVQSNWWLPNATVPVNYNFALRELTLVPFTESTPNNSPDPAANLAMLPGTVPIDYAAHYGHVDYLNDGRTDLFEDSWDGQARGDAEDIWGVTWPQSYTVDTVVYTAGPVYQDGGWFRDRLRVQVRKSLEWTEVTGIAVEPPYPNSNAAATSTFTFTFDAVAADGVRIIGLPGGEFTFTSIAELAVYYTG